MHLGQVPCPVRASLCTSGSLGYAQTRLTFPSTGDTRPGCSYSHLGLRSRFSASCTESEFKPGFARYFSFSQPLDSSLGLPFAYFHY